MEWTEDGIVLGVKRHGEANAILEVMTHAHGRHLGLVRGGAGSRLRPVLQPGNSIRAVWRARLDEHLGNFAVEGLQLRAAAFLGASHAVYGVTHVAALCRLLPERDPHPAVYTALTAVVERLAGVDAAAPDAAATMMVRFEFDLLAMLGFGLDLTACAATGERDDLIYVSPKSGRAVSGRAGAPWRDKLLRLPSFLCGARAAGEPPPSAGDLADGFALTGFFLARDVLAPRGIHWPQAREGFIAAVARAVPAVANGRQV